MQIFKTITVIR